MRFAWMLSMLLLSTWLSAQDWRYHATLDADSERLQMQVCAPDASAPLRLVATDAAARDYLLSDADWIASPRRLQMRWRGPGACARYEVDLQRLTNARRIGAGFRIDHDLLVWPAALIWWPADPAARITLDVGLPPGWQLSAPWPRQFAPAQAGAGSTLRYRLDGWPRDWPGLIALGPLVIDQQTHGAGVVELAVLGEHSAATQANLRRWIAHSAGLLDQVSGGLPVASVQVLVVPLPGGAGGPVPWGQNTRAGGGGVHFFVHPQLPYQDFIDDWTAAHEFSHLLHPYFGNRDRWMGEGLASYYQNVLRARAGDLRADQGWERLLAGFERGRNDPAQALALSEVAQTMRQRHAFMRVYWSGAAYWLAADVDLRQRSGGALTLDDALTRFARCCLPARQQWSAMAFAERLDQLTGYPVFAERARAAAAAEHFPDLDPLYQTLGLKLDANRAFAGYRKAQGQTFRNAIMAPRQPRAGTLPAAAGHSGTQPR